MSKISSETLFFDGIFLALPAVLLALRFLWRKPQWWMIVTLIIVVGWADCLLSVITHFDDLYQRVEATDTPSPELLDQAFSDGGPLVFAALFGWLIALAYAAPWFVLFWMATWLRNLVRRFRRADD
jgi:hypothetical protein